MARDFKSKISNWDARAKAHNEYQANNPFSDAWSGGQSKIAAPGDADYGRPKAGSHTAIRGAQAHAHVSSEIVVLIQVLRRVGFPTGDGYIEVRRSMCSELRKTQLAYSVSSFFYRRHSVICFRPMNVFPINWWEYFCVQDVKEL